MVFLKKKNPSPQKNIFFYLFSLQRFSADATMFSNFFFFFDHKKLKNLTSKVAHNRPKPFLRQSSPGHSPQPRSSFPFYKKPNPNVSLLVSVSGTVSRIAIGLHFFTFLNDKWFWTIVHLQSSHVTVTSVLELELTELIQCRLLHIISCGNFTLFRCI